MGARPLVFPTPVFLVGSYDEQNKPNIMTASWGGLCSSQPPALAVSLRKARWSYKSILQRQAFTVSIPSREFVRHADYAGIFSGKDENKFETLGLTPVAGEHVDAPYVAEFPMVLELKLLQTVEVGVHIQFIGEIMDVKVADSCLDAAGTPDITKVDPILFAPSSKTYHGVGDFLAKAFSIGKSWGNVSDD